MLCYVFHKNTESLESIIIPRPRGSIIFWIVELTHSSKSDSGQVMFLLQGFQTNPHQGISRRQHAVKPGVLPMPCNLIEMVSSSSSCWLQFGMRNRGSEDRRHIQVQQTGRGGVESISPGFLHWFCQLYFYSTSPSMLSNFALSILIFLHSKIPSFF